MHNCSSDMHWGERDTCLVLNNKHGQNKLQSNIVHQLDLLGAKSGQLHSFVLIIQGALSN